MNKKNSYISDNSKIGKDVIIENGVTIEEDVEIGPGTWIGPNVVLFNGTRIGKNCKIFPGAVIASAPQDVKYNEEKSFVEIGDNTIIKEYVTIGKSSIKNGITKIGKNCLLMAYSHVGHDCEVGDKNIFINNVTLAGHIKIGNNVTLGASSAVQPYQSIGDFVYTGWNCGIIRDIPPYLRIASQNGPLRYVGINIVGLRRAEYDKEIISEIKKIYRIVYESNLNTTQAITRIENTFSPSRELNKILSFIKTSPKGIFKKIG